MIWLFWEVDEEHPPPPSLSPSFFLLLLLLCPLCPSHPFHSCSSKICSIDIYKKQDLCLFQELNKKEKKNRRNIFVIWMPVVFATSGHFFTCVCGLFHVQTIVLLNQLNVHDHSLACQLGTAIVDIKDTSLCKTWYKCLVHISIWCIRQHYQHIINCWIYYKFCVTDYVKSLICRYLCTQ